MTNSNQRSLVKFYRKTFWKVVAIIYTAGTVAHVMRLAARFEMEDMPFFPDWGLVILGSYGVSGLVVFSGQIEYRGNWEKITHWLITVHLLISIVVHILILAVRSHEVLSVFGFGYSYFAVLYFGFFAWRSWTMRLASVHAGAI
jgi:hypothetical protein